MSFINTILFSVSLLCFWIVPVFEEFFVHIGASHGHIGDLTERKVVCGIELQYGQQPILEI